MGLVAVLVHAVALWFAAESVAATLPRSRPSVVYRTFNSPFLETQLAEFDKKSWLDANLQALFWNCLPNTLDATVKHFSSDARRENTYLLVGNINTSIIAMWLRDSSN
jgi:meiotically up-regulated gene 157 (Mug157) protein